MPDEPAARRSDARPGRDAPLLEVEDLRVDYRDGDGEPVRALDGVSFELAAGESLGVLGESGGGKSTLALAILGLLPAAGRVAGGAIRFRRRRLDGLAERELERVRGAEIGLVFQEPTLGRAPDPRELPPGCGFASRCDRRMGACDARPPWRTPRTAHSAACFLYDE